MKYISILIILFYVLSAQNLEGYYNKLNSGNIDQARKEILDLAEDHPDDPEVQLLHGIAIQDGEKAVNIFDEIVENHPDTKAAERAQVELLKYYFTLGLYQKTRKRAEKFIENYSSSEAIQEVVVLLFRSLRYSADSTTVENYREEYANRFPACDSIIKNIDYSSPYNVEEAQPINMDSGNEVSYTIQIGVFSNPENIEKIKQRLKKEGYEVYVNERNEEETAVQVGKYTTRGQAHRVAQKIKNSLQLDSMIKKINE